MKLTLHSFDFGEETITFRVPKNVLLSNSFGAVPRGVEVDLEPVTGNADLGIKVLSATDRQQTQPTIALADLLPILNKHLNGRLVRDIFDDIPKQQANA